MEKRLPAKIVVRLSRVKNPQVTEEELTYTDNVSTRGARVVTKHAWQPGEVAQIASLKAEIPIRGKVVYCQQLGDNRYAIGLNFQQRRITWPALSTYRNI